MFVAIRRRILLARALRMVNRMRAERGLPALRSMPVGRRLSPMGCPVARALNADIVSTRIYHETWNDQPKPLPPVLVRFATWFDCGDFPELIANPNPEN